MTKTKTINENITKDTKILVSKDGCVWQPRYLSRVLVSCEGAVMVFAYIQGRDSYTSQEILNPNAREEKWEYAELYTYFYEE